MRCNCHVLLSCCVMFMSCFMSFVISFFMLCQSMSFAKLDDCCPVGFVVHFGVIFARVLPGRGVTCCWSSSPCAFVAAASAWVCWAIRAKLCNVFFWSSCVCAGALKYPIKMGESPKIMGVHPKNEPGNWGSRYAYELLPAMFGSGSQAVEASGDQEKHHNDRRSGLFGW